MRTLEKVLIAALMVSCSACGRISIGGFSTDETVRRTDSAPLLMNAGDVLDVASDFGSIAVEITEKDVPGVVAEIQAAAPTKAEADTVLGRFAPEVVRTGSTVKIRLAGQPLEIETDGRKRSLSANASFVVKAPPGIEVLAKTGSGSIRIAGPASKVGAESGFGSVRATGVRGKVDLKSGSGSVDAIDCRGGDVAIRSDFGSLSAKDGAGSLLAKTGSGSITVEGWIGSLEGRSEFGSVTAEGVFDRVTVGTGSGGVDVRGGAGSKAFGAWSLQSDFGSVKCRLPRDFDAAVSAETSFGSVRIDHPGLPAESKDSSKRYTGVLGKGGQPLTLKAGSGSITLTALDG